MFEIEPYDIQLISMLLYPRQYYRTFAYTIHFHVLYPCHRYRTFAYTIHLHVPLSLPPLQNLCIHNSPPWSSIPAAATEPLYTRFISMFRYPSHRYRTFLRKKNPGDKSHWSSFYRLSNIICRTVPAWYQLLLRDR